MALAFLGVQAVVPHGLGCCSFVLKRVTNRLSICRPHLETGAWEGDVVPASSKLQVAATKNLIGRCSWSLRLGFLETYVKANINLASGSVNGSLCVAQVDKSPPSQESNLLRTGSQKGSENLFGEEGVPDVSPELAMIGSNQGNWLPRVPCLYRPEVDLNSLQKPPGGGLWVLPRCHVLRHGRGLLCSVAAAPWIHMPCGIRPQKTVGLSA